MSLSKGNWVRGSGSSKSPLRRQSAWPCRKLTVRLSAQAMANSASPMWFWANSWKLLWVSVSSALKAAVQQMTACNASDNDKGKRFDEIKPSSPLRHLRGRTEGSYGGWRIEVSQVPAKSTAWCYWRAKERCQSTNDGLSCQTGKDEGRQIAVHSKCVFLLLEKLARDERSIRDYPASLF